MKQILALIMSIITALSLYFGTAGSPDYNKTTGLKSAIEALINMDEILNTKYVGKVSDEKWSEETEYSLDDTILLKKEKGENFVILNLSDVHFADYDERAFMAFSTTANIRKMVANVRPDLITVSGDIVCSDSTHYAVRRFTDLMEGFGIPWAPIFGNHDADGNCDYNYVADVMMSAPNCLMRKGDPEMGIGNYIINIAEDTDDGTTKIVESIIMMDCATSQRNEKQNSWVKWAAEGINSLTGNTAEITLFTHIPLPEYQYTYDEAFDTETGKWKDGYAAFGEKNEEVAFKRDHNGKPVQEGFFDTLKEVGTKYVFCGHDHLNNFSLLYEGIRLTYCLKVGHGSGYEFKFNGGTEITIDDTGITNIKQKTVAFGPVVVLEEIEC